jgi:adenylylsulfate kinase
MRDTASTSQGLAVWFTGLSGAGKTTLCRALEPALLALGQRVRVLDAEEIRRDSNRDLGFSKADRDENVARIGSIARNLVKQNIVVLVAAISPYREARGHVRAQIGSVRPGSFLEVHVDSSLDTCIRRDPKGLYSRALAGALPHFTGIDDPYEAPLTPDVHCDTGHESLAESAAKVLAAIRVALGNVSAVLQRTAFD